MASLAKAGISMHDVTEKPVEDGVRLFSDALDQLLSAVARKAPEGVETKHLEPVGAR
jgi:hypothetical protein